MSANFDSTIMKDLRGYMTQDQMNKLEFAAKNTRDKLLLRVLSRTGRRVTEIVGREKFVEKVVIKNQKTKEYVKKEVERYKINGLRPMDINWDEGTCVFNILKKKRQKKAIKIIDKQTLSLLRQYIATRGIKKDERIFPISRQRVFQIVRECAERAGIQLVGEKRPHPHHYRHSFAVNLIRRSKRPADIRILQTHLDHSSLNVTATYLQFDQEEMRKLLERAFPNKEE